MQCIFVSNLNFRVKGYCFLYSLFVNGVLVVIGRRRFDIIRHKIQPNESLKLIFWLLDSRKCQILYFIGYKI